MSDQDPFASIAQPIQADAFASIAKPIPAQTPTAGERLRSSFAEGLGITSDEGAKQFFEHPINTLMNSLEAQGQLAIKAKQAYQRGDYKGALMHGLNYLVPFIGQQTDKAGEQLNEGDYAGGIGRTLGAAVPIVAGSPEVRAGVSEAASTAMNAAKPVVGPVARAGEVALDNPIAGAIQPRLPHIGKALGRLADALEKSQKTHAEIADVDSGIWRDATRENAPYAGEEAPIAATYPGAPLPEHPGEFPGAPNPSVPPPQLLQARSLASPGAAPSAPQADALGSLPTAPRATPKLPAGFGPPEAQYQSPSGTVDNPLAIPGEEGEAPAARPSKSQLSKQLETLLNDATGGKPLQPGVPLRNQNTITQTQPASLTEGHTPVESSAVRSYKYDADAHELHVTANNGVTYVSGEVTPAQAADFASADSKGLAWKDIRDNSPLVAKIVNGKRVAVTPTAGRSATPEGTAEPAPPKAPVGDDLLQLLEKSLSQAKAGKDAAAEAPKTTSPASPTVPSQPADGRTGPSAALYEPREPEFPVASGAPTNITVPGTDRSIPAQYEVRELSDIHPYEEEVA